MEKGFGGFYTKKNVIQVINYLLKYIQVCKNKKLYDLNGFIYFFGFHAHIFSIFYTNIIFIG